MRTLSDTLKNGFLSSLFIGAAIVAHSQEYAFNTSENNTITGAMNAYMQGNENSSLSAKRMESFHIATNNNISESKKAVAAPVSLTANLLQFNAALSNGDVLLNWETANETEAIEYIVEYSNNGSTWEKIGAVAPRHSADFNSYQFTHFNAAAAFNQYRLKMIDAGGKVAYSASRSVALKNVDGSELNVFPNPFTDVLQLEYQNSDKHDFVKIFVTDVTGKLLQMSDWTLAEGLNKTTLALKKLPGGVYFLTIRNNTNGAVMLQRKIIKN